MFSIQKSGAAILIAMLVSACEGRDPTAPVEPPDPPPAVFPSTATVTLQAIQIESGCDENLLIPGPGGYSYYVRASASSGGSHVLQTQNYGSVLGEHKTAAQLEKIQLNRPFTFTNLDETSTITVQFRAIEWDFLDMDPRLNNKSASKNSGYPSGTVGYKIWLGQQGCLVRLDYSVAWEG